VLLNYLGVKVDVFDITVVDTSGNALGTASNALIACYGTSWLGANILTDGKIPTNPTMIKDLATLLTANDPDPSNTGIPGLYIMGVDQGYVGSGVSVVPGKTASAANASSILQMLIWKNPSGAPYVTLYHGGDAENQQEDPLIPVLNGARITNVKAGHHGSRKGTSMKFYDAVRPDHYFLSAGTTHQHPGMLSLAWVSLILLERKAKDI
jgi:hypothetical protein